MAHHVGGVPQPHRISGVVRHLPHFMRTVQRPPQVLGQWTVLDQVVTKCGYQPPVCANRVGFDGRIEANRAARAASNIA